MMMTHRVCFAVIALLAAAAPTAAQQPPVPVPAAPAKAGAEQTPGLPTPPPNFQYTPDGRRDPFLSLVNRGTDAGAGQNAKRAEGSAGLLTGELVVRGTLLTQGTWVALVAGPDGKVLTVRAGDRLSDGVIKAVTAQAVVILQEVNDPLSLEKQREVRKLLRGGEEVK